MATCDKCGNKIGILAKKHYYEDEDGKKLIYCSECDEEHEEYFSYPGKKKGSYEITPEQVTNEEPETPDIDNKKREKAIMEVTILIVAKKKFEQALKKFEPIFDKRLESDWYTKGNIYANLGKTKDAIKCYDEALYLDTHYAKAWYRKGWVLIETKEFKNAIKCFENVIKLQDIGEPYSNSNWALASKFSKMLALIYYNNSLIFKKKASKKITVKTGEAIEEIVPYLTSPIIIGSNDRGKGQLINFDFSSTSLNDFVDECIKKHNEVLNVLEPPVVVEFPQFGEKH